MSQSEAGQNSELSSPHTSVLQHPEDTDGRRKEDEQRGHQGLKETDGGPSQEQKGSETGQHQPPEQG